MTATSARSEPVPEVANVRRASAAFAQFWRSASSEDHGLSGPAMQTSPASPLFRRQVQPRTRMTTYLSVSELLLRFGASGRPAIRTLRKTAGFRAARRRLASVCCDGAPPRPLWHPSTRSTSRSCPRALRPRGGPSAARWRPTVSDVVRGVGKIPSLSMPFRCSYPVSIIRFSDGAVLTASREKVMSDDKRLKKRCSTNGVGAEREYRSDIGVTAKDGVVTLLGHVENFLEKSAAEKAARRSPTT